MLTVEQQAALNNVRAIVKRQLRPTSMVDPLLVADLILANAPMLRDMGQGPELLDYLERVQYRVPEESPHYLRLMVETAVTMDREDGMWREAAQLHREVLERYESADTALDTDHADARLAYGRHLLDRGKMTDAQEQFQRALTLLTSDSRAVTLSELGRTYLGLGQFQDAVSHFERGLELMPEGKSQTKTRADLATALIQLGELSRAEGLLNDALQTCNQQGWWALRGKVKRSLAYVNQMQVESEPSSRRMYLRRAETLLHDAIDDLLPLHQSLELAIAYHDLGRLEAQQRKFADAEEHVRLSSQLFGRLGSRRNFAVAQITLGQILMVHQDDAPAATERIMQALSIAAELDDQFTQRQAAESLVRIHRMQLRSDDSPGVVTHIAHTRSRLEALGLVDYVAELDALVGDGA